MRLSTSQIKDTLENVEDLSPKCLAIIITDMAEHLEYIEHCYLDLSVKYNMLKNEYNDLKKSYTKLHINQIYGKVVTESSKYNQIIADALKGEHKT
jgi:hypothetical protein